MYQTILSTDSLPWMPLDFSGVSIRVLYRDVVTRGITVMTRMEPGATIPAHFHTHADELVFVVSGDFIEAGETYQSGAFFAGAAGTMHGPHESRTGCMLLTTFSAPLDFQP